MKFLLAVLLTALLSFLAGIYFEWWSIAIVAFLVALFFNLRSGPGFLAGFLALFLLWGILAFWIDMKNEHMLSHKMAQLFPLGGSAILIILVTGLIGGLVGGFASMAGSSLRPVKKRRY